MFRVKTCFSKKSVKYNKLIPKESELKISNIFLSETEKNIQ
jgi:hypothetical protein